ncbi:MAG TPA: FRG domain-containing protein, partial [Saprospiraceae bacterium]
MKNGFLELIEEILSHSQKIIANNEVNEVYYRGHSRVDYQLLPGLARLENLPKQQKLEGDDLLNFESRLASGFMQYGNHLISQHRGSWDPLYLMQHHGLPTRLLDWTESLMTALYFAVCDAKEDSDAAVWVLDPYALNNTEAKKEDYDVLEYLDVRYPEGYYHYFVDTRMNKSEPFPKRILAIAS